MDSFDKQLSAILSGAVVKIRSNSDRIAQKHAQKLARKIRAASPVDTKSWKRANFKGHYKDGWKSGKGYTNSVGSYEYTVYNSSKYQLTHLLENGHIAANGKRVGKRPHINDNARAEIDEYIKDMEAHATDDT